MTHRGPFQPRTFCDAVTAWSPSCSSPGSAGELEGEEARWAAMVSQSIDLLSLLSQVIHAMAAQSLLVLCLGSLLWGWLWVCFAAPRDNVTPRFVWIHYLWGSTILALLLRWWSSLWPEAITPCVRMSSGFLSWAVKWAIPRKPWVLHKEGVNQLIIVPSVLQCSKWKLWKIWGEIVLGCEKNQYLDFCS